VCTFNVSAQYDGNCFYYYKKWFSTLDWGTMRSNLLFCIWDYRWVVFTFFASLFFERKNMLKEKAVSPRSHPTTWYIHTHVCFVHIYESYMPRFGPSGFGPSWCLSRPLGSHPSTPYMQCVCVCVRVHLHPHTLPPALKIEKTQTILLSLLLSK